MHPNPPSITQMIKYKYCTFGNVMKQKPAPLRPELPIGQQAPWPKIRIHYLDAKFILSKPTTAPAI